MVFVVGVPEVLYLSQSDIIKVDLPLNEVIDAVEGVIIEKGNGHVEMPPKPGIHPKRERFHICYACLYP